MSVKKPVNKSFDCTIIVPSYNTKKITDKCLIYAEKTALIAKKDLENITKIIVVDNASSDGSVGMIRKKHKGVKLISLKKNIGYARANNLAMKKANTPYILLINSDLYLKKDTLLKSLGYMDKHKNRDALSCRVLDAKEKFYPYGGYLPTPYKMIRWILGVESLPVISYFLHRIYTYNTEFYKHDFQMEWCPTGFFLLRKKVYEKTKGFDEKLFLYMEDIEWCKRIKDKGFSIWYTPEIEVIHLGGASTQKLELGEKLQDQIDGLKEYFSFHYSNSGPFVFWFLKTGLKVRRLFYFLTQKTDKALIYGKVKI